MPWKYYIKDAQNDYNNIRQNWFQDIEYDNRYRDIFLND